MGANFDALVTVAEDDVVEYWPGGTPGMPEMAWSSNVATIAVRVNKTGLNEADFLAKVGRLREQLEDLLPSWMTLTIGTGTTFVVGLDLVGQDLI
jgi:glutaredoxin-related protein